jgi:hypothetical protein
MLFFVNVNMAEMRYNGSLFKTDDCGGDPVSFKEV